MNKSCFISWSGGKDSCLALYKSMEKGFSPKRLFTMFSMENGISTAHRLKEEIIKAQAAAIGIEYTIAKALFNDYEQVFISNIKLFRDQGIKYGVFGDIDILEHRQWEEEVCRKASVEVVLPLWQRDRKEIVKEFISLGFKAKIVLVDTSMLDKKFLGQDLSYSLLKEVEEFGADICGENGEYHTVVYDGPIFKKAVDLSFGTEAIQVGERWAQIDVRSSVEN